jgi:hypothetical protein
MPFFFAFPRRFEVSRVLAFAVLFLMSTDILLPRRGGSQSAFAQDSPSPT